MKLRGKVRTAEAAALWIGTAVAAVSVPFAAVATVAGIIPAWASAAACLSFFAIGYGTARWTIHKFVVFKIKPIYQIVLSRNVSTKALEDELSEAGNRLEKVSDELSHWAETNRKEIARLKENEKYRKEFLGNVSHEIKTPIFNIQGYITTLLDGALDDRSINRTYLERAEKSIDRLIDIVNDLDEISRLESGMLRLEKKRFDVVALARDVMETAEMEAGRKQISLVVHPPVGAASLPVLADKRYIGQVLGNLVVNSIRYGRPGGKTVVSFIDMFDKAMVEVADDGIGIAREDVPRIFERFYRTDKSRSREQGGTGLGLAIVKHILEAHDETISVRSEPGKGSTFSFTLKKQ